MFLPVPALHSGGREPPAGFVRWKIDFLDAARACQDNGWLDNDFTVRDDCKILKYLTGHKCTKEIVQDPGIVKGNEYTVEKWAWDKKTHFRRRGWDVYKNSQTVRNGVRQCYYKYKFLSRI